MGNDLPKKRRMLQNRKPIVDYAALRKYLVVQKDLEINSIRQVIGRVQIFEQWLVDHQKNVSKESVEDFFLYKKEEEGRNNNTLNTYVFAFRMLRDYCAARGIEWGKELSEVKSRRKEEAEIDPLTVDEIGKILKTDVEYGLYLHQDPTKYLNTLYRAMTLVFIYTGCRYENCARLAVKDVFIDKSVLRFRDLKNHMKYLDSWVPSVVLDAIRPFLIEKQPDDLVFVSFYGRLYKKFLQPVAPSCYGDELRRRAKKVGITKRVHPHIFRHSFGTRLLENGVELENVAKMLGHKDIQSTYRYYDHVSAQFLKVEKRKDPMVADYITDEQTYEMAKERLTNMRMSPKTLLYVVKRLYQEFL